MAAADPVQDILDAPAPPSATAAPAAPAAPVAVPATPAPVRVPLTQIAPSAAAAAPSADPVQDILSASPAEISRKYSAAPSIPTTPIQIGAPYSALNLPPDLQKRADQIISSRIGALAGPLEFVGGGVGSFLVNAASVPWGVGSGVGAALHGGSWWQGYSEGQKAFDDWASDKLKLHPETDAGKALTNIASLPFVGLEKGGQYIDEKTGLPIGTVLETIGKAGLTLLPLARRGGEEIPGAAQPGIPQTARQQAAADLLQEYQLRQEALARQAQQQAGAGAGAGAGRGVGAEGPAAAPVTAAPVTAGTVGAEAGRPGVSAANEPIEPSAELRASAGAGGTMGGGSRLVNDMPFTEGQGNTVSTAQQLENARVLRNVGFDRVRRSAVTGNVNEAVGDWEQRKLVEEPAGQAAAAAFTNERQVLSNYLGKFANDVGGSIDDPLNKQNDLYSRGKQQVDPLDDIREGLDQKRKGMYAATDAKSGGEPSVSLDNFKTFLDTDSKFGGIAENGNLRNGVRSYLREQNIMDKDGNLRLVTAQEAEGVRQYINSQYLRQTSELARQWKGAIDSDVLTGTGENAYEDPRNVQKELKRTYDNPKGISQLMDFDPQSPTMNRTVPYEKAPDFITQMPADEFSHLVGVYKNAPPEQQASAQAGLGAMKAQYINKVYDIGTKNKEGWNADGVRVFIGKNSQNMQQLFSPEEMQQFYDLNAAGHLLKVRGGYVGAEAQKAGFLARGLTPLAATAGTSLGGAIGLKLGMPGQGATVGGALGTGLALKYRRRAALDDWNNRRMVDLSNFTGRQ